MSDQTNDPGREREEVWEARVAALASILGQPTDDVFHAIMPFKLGGFADVLAFPGFVPGMTYATAELTGEDSGQRPTTLGNYELMICAKQELPQAGALISQLARYTCETEVEAGETMDVGEFLGDSSIRALLFAHPREQPVHFELLGRRCGLLLCIGITEEELACVQSQGSAMLLDLLKQHGVFPYTIPDRPSVPLPRPPR